MGVEIRNIAVATDFSEFSKAGIRYARALAESFGARVHLVHVLERPQDVPWWLSEQEYHGRRGALEQEARAKLDALVQEELPGLTVTTVLRSGPPAREICAAAEEADADLIVIATHGRSGIAHAVFGSVAEKVVRQAPCPVLTVRPPEE